MTGEKFIMRDTAVASGRRDVQSDIGIGPASRCRPSTAAAHPKSGTSGSSFARLSAGASDFPAHGLPEGTTGPTSVSDGG